MSFKNLIVLATSGTLLTACMTAQEHRADVSSGPSTFSLGKVQSSVHQGMSQEQVISCLGSPNIVTNDDSGSETWVYDKIASDAAYSTSSGGGGIGGHGGGLIGSALLGGLGSVGGNKSAGAYETSQKTLTVMIKFDRRRQVNAINYHQSKF